MVRFWVYFEELTKDKASGRGSRENQELGFRLDIRHVVGYDLKYKGGSLPCRHAGLTPASFI